MDTQNKKVRISIKAVIIRERKLLVLKKKDEEGYFYTLPGGGQEHSETIEQALLRECMEEVSLKIKMKRLLFIRDYIAINHEVKVDSDRNIHQVELMFESEILEGTPAAGNIPDNGQLSIDWLDLNNIEDCRLYPKAIRKYLKNFESIDETIYLGDIN